MSGDEESACDEGFRRESQVAKNIAGDGESACSEGSPESLGWRGICLAPRNLPVLRVPDESLGLRGTCQATGNLPVIKAPTENFG